MPLRRKVHVPSLRLAINTSSSEQLRKSAKAARVIDENDVVPSRLSHGTPIFTTSNHRQGSVYRPASGYIVYMSGCKEVSRMH